MAVRPAKSPEDLARVREVLALAFAGDPPLRWLVPGPARRERLLPVYFRALVPRLYAPHGEILISDDPLGAAVWAAPGRWPPPKRKEIATWPALLRVFGRHPRQTLIGAARIEKGHPKEPHWYLDYIAVHPAAHGRGTGSALLRPVLDRCDQERLPAYLNAGSENSRRLYGRHGFQTMEEVPLPFGGPSVWRMWREPR